MSVYVDSIKAYDAKDIAGPARRHGQFWCHLWADTREELDEMADRLGLLAWWCQHPDSPTLCHYDLVPSMRQRAIAAGAVEMEYLDYLRAKRQEGG